MINKKQLFHFNFLNKDFSLNIEVNVLKSSTYVKNILMEGSVSQICYIGLSFCLSKKKGNF